MFLRRLAAAGLILVQGCSFVPDDAPEASRASTKLATLTPGPVDGLPPGVAGVTGTCTGRIALTPTDRVERAAGDDPLSYAAYYDCATRRFVLLSTDGYRRDRREFADLNLTATGYYVNEYRRVDRERYGNYSFFGTDGVRRLRFERLDLDPHDVLVGEDSILYMKYTTPRPLPRDDFACGLFPIELELDEEAWDGSALWHWSSENRLDTAWEVPRARQDALPPRGGVRGALDALRHCYTRALKEWTTVETPSGFLAGLSGPFFQVRTDDYIHANSLARVGRSGDVLVSARHLDALFIVDRASGAIKWVLGGPASKIPGRRPLADPQGGFSHQHSASIAGGRLYVFDNGNSTPGRPSRAVIYSIDESQPGDATFVSDFAEPDGLERVAEGSVQPIPGGRLLIGWGTVGKKDEQRTTRAVSIVDTRSGREEFAIDFAPGWASYRARYAE